MAKHEHRDPNYYRRLLLDKSAITGGITSGLLGANFGLAIPIILGWVTMIPLSLILGLMIGSLSGIVMARHRVIRRRVDLFGNVAHLFDICRAGLPTPHTPSVR